MLLWGFLLKTPKRFCRRASCALSSHFHFDECRFVAKLPGPLYGQGNGFFFAAGQQREMIVLDDDRVGEAEPVRAAVSEMQRALIEQTTRSFSRAHNMDRWGAPARALL